jgi:hypothetical protein
MPVTKQSKRRRGMKCDGNKVIELRTKNALTQEALA